MTRRSPDLFSEPENRFSPTRCRTLNGCPGLHDFRTGQDACRKAMEIFPPKKVPQHFVLLERIVTFGELSHAGRNFIREGDSSPGNHKNTNTFSPGPQ